jgi:uncharacterized membrane protein YccC
VDLFGIPGAVVVQGGAVAVLILAVIGILTGRIVPARVVDRLEKLYAAAIDKEKARGDEWRAAAQAQDARNDLLSQQVSQLLDAARTTNALIEGLRQASQERRR